MDEVTEKPHVIAGKYQLVKQLGRGAMGSVWQARHLTLRSSVAIKLMDPAIAATSSGLQRFMLEARAAAELRSPHVVQVLDHGVDQGTPFMVMEMLEGESLASRLERVGHLSRGDTARVVKHVARALSRAHRAGITHRDLKPDNVFLVHNEDEEIVKVLDFGIAKVTMPGLEQSFDGESTAAGALLGTPYYVSPEQAEGLKSVDHRTDVWSLGVMTFECLLGRRPFDGETLPALLLAICRDAAPVPSSLGTVPAGFDAWFGRACSRDLGLRFGSAKEASAAFDALCETTSPTSDAPLGERSTPAAPPEESPLADEARDANSDDGEAPTEIWRDGAMERLALGIDSDQKLESKAGFSATAHGTQQSHAVRSRSLVALGLLAAFAAGLVWLRSTTRVISPERASASTSGLVSAPVAPVAPPGLVESAPTPSASPPPAPEKVPTIDVSLLPVASPSSRAVPLAPKAPPPLVSSRPPAPGSSAPSVAAFGDTPATPSEARPMSDTRESLRNPYR